MEDATTHAATRHSAKNGGQYCTTAAAQVAPIIQCQRTNNCPANKLVCGVLSAAIRSSAALCRPLPFIARDFPFFAFQFRIQFN